MIPWSRSARVAHHGARRVRRRGHGRGARHRHLVPVLEEVVAPLGVRVVQGDALEVDWAELLAGHDRWTLVANLPYNVGTTIVLQLLDDVPAIHRMLVMVQREVGERLAAPPGSDLRHPLGEGRTVGHRRGRGQGAGHGLHPHPRSTVVLVRLTRSPEPSVDVDDDDLMPPAPGLGQRRKTLRRSLAGPRPEAFAAAGVDPHPTRAARASPSGLRPTAAVVGPPVADPDASTAPRSRMRSRPWRYGRMLRTGGERASARPGGRGRERP